MVWPQLTDKFIALTVTDSIHPHRQAIARQRQTFPDWDRYLNTIVHHPITRPGQFNAPRRPSFCTAVF